MCGIVGYVGSAGACDVLLAGLRRLEYRGYDSAGIALIGEDELHLCKSVGKVQRLAEQVAGEWGDGIARRASAGICHTRWATHGAPTVANAHPHLDQSGRIAVVHNGIIENHAVLRQRLEALGQVFASQTDTEALARLIGECYRGDLAAAVTEALRNVTGAYGIVVVSADHPDEMVAARKGSPLIVGLGAGETLVASDVTAVIGKTRQVIYLEDGDVAHVRAGGRVEIRTLDQMPVSRGVAEVDWDTGAAEKGGFAHFMLKEIFDQPEAIRNALRGRLDLEAGTAVCAGLGMSPREMAAVRRIVVVACGTSLHAGMAGKYAFEALAGIPVEAEQAAEFRYRNPILSPDDLVLAISQSGETADTLAAVREAMGKGTLVAGVCNVVGSTIARTAGRGVYLHAGPEIGVASTKAFTSQLTVLTLLALKFARGRRLSREEGIGLCRELQALPDAVLRVLEQSDRIAALAERYTRTRDMFFIGRGVLYPVALEGALKLKEISYIHAEGYHAAELKHGPIALLDDQVPVVALLSDIPGKEKTLGNAHECRARGAPVLGFVTAGDAEARAVTDDAVELPRLGPHTTPIAVTVALQLLAYHVARLRGCGIDQPRNLAKSVTVE